MRIFSLLPCALISAFIAMPATALECANAGAAALAPDDTGDGSATACGPSALAGGSSSIALGSTASSTGPSSTALGSFASSEGASSTAVGNTASSNGTSSVALGYVATSSGSFSTALGSVTNAEADSSTALGFGAYAQGANSTALGFGAHAAGANSSALGNRAFANQHDTVVLGSIPGVNFGTAYANVGIGTDTPVEAVDVARSEAAARFQLSSFTNTANEAPQYIQRRARGTSAAPVAVQNGDNLGLFSFRGYNGATMGGSRATITAQAAGNFSGTSTPTRLIFATTPVGQTAPQQVLVITPDGKVQVNGQNLTVPDYVFEDDYELMPLKELQAFIDANGHLPGIPSADEVNAGAHDLAGSDMAHLRKIEELTLYTLLQQEQLTTQEARLNAQQLRIEQLETLLTRALTTID